MRPRGTGKALVEFVRVRVPLTQKRALLAVAASKGVSVSELMRQAMTEAAQRLAA